MQPASACTSATTTACSPPFQKLRETWAHLDRGRARRGHGIRAADHLSTSGRGRCTWRPIVLRVRAEPAGSGKTPSTGAISAVAARSPPPPERPTPAAASSRLVQWRSNNFRTRSRHPSSSGLSTASAAAAEHPVKWSLLHPALEHELGSKVPSPHGSRSCRIKSIEQGDRDRSRADRPHAPLHPPPHRCLRSDPPVFLPPRGGQGAAAPGRGNSFQTSKGTCEPCSGRE